MPCIMEDGIRIAVNAGSRLLWQHMFPGILGQKLVCDDISSATSSDMDFIAANHGFVCVTLLINRNVASLPPSTHEHVLLQTNGKVSIETLRNDGRLNQPNPHMAGDSGKPLWPPHRAQVRTFRIQFQLVLLPLTPVVAVSVHFPISTLHLAIARRRNSIRLAKTWQK